MNKVSDFVWIGAPDYEILQGTSYKKAASKTKLVQTPNDLRWYTRTLKKPSDFITSKRTRKRFTYKPLVYHPELFLEFKDLNIDSDKEVIGFAKKYGLLGGECKFDFKPDDRGINSGDSLVSWAWEQMWLKMAHSFWSYLRTGEEKYIPGKFVERSFYPNYLEIISLKLSKLDILRPKILLTVFDPAEFNAKEETEKSFLCRKHLEQILNGQLRHRFSINTQINYPAKSLINFIPNSLVGAIWLQLAQAVAELKDFQHCLECNNWIEISSERKRKDVKYCSNACRVKAYRKRKKDKQS